MTIKEIIAKEIDRIAGLLTSDVRDCSRELDAAFMGHEYEVRQAFIKTLTEEIGDILDGVPHDKDCRTMFKRVVAWIRSWFVKPRWFPLDWGTAADPQEQLRGLFPWLKGSFQRPGNPVARPYRRLLPRYTGRPTFRYRRALRFYIVEPYTP